jgi:hypothetical protein
VAVVSHELVGEGLGDGDQAAERLPLDLHEGICDPRVGCTRWPEHLRLLNRATGEVVEGRCRATNLCRYCQVLYVVETLEMLALDAAENAPTIWVVLTAREHLTRQDTYGHLRQLRKAARKRWPDVEWFVQVEFQRRGALHLNLLVKGVPADEREELHELLVTRWCKRVDALPAGQWSDTVADAGGVSRYLQKTLAHGLKREQAPPIGWRGHRTSQTRGYLVRSAAVMRQEAKAALRLKRELRRAIGRGLGAHDAELAAQEAVAAAAEVAGDWTLYEPRRRKLPAADGPTVAKPVWDGMASYRKASKAARELAGRWGQPVDQVSELAELVADAHAELDRLEAAMSKPPAGPIVALA